MLEWKHEENGETTFLQVPIKIKNSANKTSGLGGSYVCNACEGKVEQTYICSECGNAHLSENGTLKKKLSLLNGLKTIVGKIEKRKDKITGIIYNENDKKTFLETTVDENMKVEMEILNQDIIDNIEYVETSYEIFNNDDEKHQDLIRKIHNFLHKKNIVLLVTFGYRGKEHGGFILSAQKKLLLFSLRDYNLIKDSIQIGIDERVSSIETKLNALTESSQPRLYKEFLKAVKENKPIEKPKETIEEKPQVVEVGFLDGF